MTTPTGNARPVAEQPKNLSTVELTERLTEQVSTLVRTEVSHALEEVKSKGTRIGVGVGISGAGAILLFLGLATLIATAVLGLATAVEPWLAALIVALVVLARRWHPRRGRGLEGEERRTARAGTHGRQCPRRHRRREGSNEVTASDNGGRPDEVADIERQRAELAATVGELTDRLDVPPGQAVRGRTRRRGPQPARSDRGGRRSRRGRARAGARETPTTEVT